MVPGGSAAHDIRVRTALRQTGWIAEVDGKRVGCVLCMAADETTAKLRIPLVRPDGRGAALAHASWTRAWTSPVPPSTHGCGC